MPAPRAGGGQQLLGEERVSLRVLEELVDEPRLGRGVEDARQLLGQFAAREAGQLEPLHRRHALDVGEELAQRMAAVQLVAPVRADE